MRRSRHGGWMSLGAVGALSLLTLAALPPTAEAGLDEAFIAVQQLLGGAQLDGSGATNGQALVFNATTTTWEPGSPVGAPATEVSGDPFKLDDGAGNETYLSQGGADGQVAVGTTDGGTDGTVQAAQYDVGADVVLDRNGVETARIIAAQLDLEHPSPSAPATTDEAYILAGTGGDGLIIVGADRGAFNSRVHLQSFGAILMCPADAVGVPNALGTWTSTGLIFGRSGVDARLQFGPLTEETGITGGVVDLTDNVDTILASWNMGSTGGQGLGAFLDYQVYVEDASNSQTESGSITVRGLTEDNGVTLLPATAIETDSVQILGAGTLDTTWTVDTTGAFYRLRLTADSSLTPTSMKVFLFVKNAGVHTSTTIAAGSP